MHQSRAAQPLHGPDLLVAEAPIIFAIRVAQHELDGDLNRAAPLAAVDAALAARGHERLELQVGRVDAPRFLQRVHVAAGALDFLVFAVDLSIFSLDLAVLVLDQHVLELLHALHLGATLASNPEHHTGEEH